LGNLFKINFVFDREFRDFPYTIEVDTTTFYELLDSLCLAATSRYRIVNPTTVLIYPDNFAKKRMLELRGIQLYYLSNLKAEDAKKMLAAVFRDDQLIMQEETGLNALAVRADYESLLYIEKLLNKLDKPRSEVELQIEIMEINRNLIKQIGNELSSWGAGASALNDEGKSVFQFDQLSSSNFFLTLPSAFFSILENWEGNKIIAKPNLRGISGEEISFAVGDEVPIPDTQFQAIAAGGINTSPVTTYKYQKVGLEIKITPFVHKDDEITIKSKLTLKFISGSGYSEAFPVLGSREVENTIRLRDGEMNIIGGFIRDDVRKSLKGFPALSKIPLLGALFGRNDDQVKQTDLIFVIKPRIIRKTDISLADLEAIWNEIKSSPAGASPGMRSDGESEPPPPPDRPAHSPEIGPSRERDQDQETAPQNNPGEGPGEEFLNMEFIPPQLTTAAKRDATITIQISGKKSTVSEIALTGELVGGQAEIRSLNADFLANTQSQKNISGQSFNVSIRFSKPVELNNNAMLLAQLLVIFETKGEYQLVIQSASAFDKNGMPLKLHYQNSSIKVL
jgi:type II secretory pathway component GspD/PulD (secretin)